MIKFFLVISLLFICWNKYLDLSLYISFFDHSSAFEIIKEISSLKGAGEAIEKYYSNEANIGSMKNNFLSFYILISLFLCLAGIISSLKADIFNKRWMDYLFFVYMIFTLEIIVKEAYYFYHSGVLNSYAQYVIAKVTKDYTSFLVVDVLYTFLILSGLITSIFVRNKINDQLNDQ